MSDVAFVALGSNLGNRAGYLASARAALSLIPATEIVGASSVEETVPLGMRPQPPYLNQMVAMRTSLTPHALLGHLHRVERSLGRVRGERWGSRTIDLDIVRFGNVQLASPGLTLPHPGLDTRHFWRGALAEMDGLRHVER